jgi:hypothetical protein
MVFIWILLDVFQTLTWLQGAPSGNDPEQDENNGDDEQDMDETADGGSGYHTQQPQNNEHNGNGV